VEEGSRELQLLRDCSLFFPAARHFKSGRNPASYHAHHAEILKPVLIAG